MTASDPTFDRGRPESWRKAFFKQPLALYKGLPAEIMKSRCVMKLTTTGRKSGLPREKIYSHTIALSTVNPTVSSFSPPVWAAVNQYCTPGFTLDPFGAAIYDLAKLKQQISEADPGMHRFAVAETYIKRHYTEEQYTQFFNEMSDSGATLIHVLGWHKGHQPLIPVTDGTNLTGPHQSVVKWLGRPAATSQPN